MRKKLAAAFGVLVLVACATGAPAPEPEPLVPQPWVEPPRVYSLIGERAELELTAEQVEALDSLGVALAEENRPLVQRARELQAGRRISQERAAILRPLLEEIRDNNLAAQNRVQEILTEEQEREVCAIFGLDRARLSPEQRRRLERAEEMRRRQAEMQGDTIPVAAGRAGIWRWCAPAAADTTAADTTARRR